MRRALALALLLLLPLVAPVAAHGGSEGYLHETAHHGVGAAPRLLAVDGSEAIIAGGGVVTWLAPDGGLTQSHWLGSAVIAAAPTANGLVAALSDGRLVRLNATLHVAWTLYLLAPPTALAIGTLDGEVRLAMADASTVFLLDPAWLTGDGNLTDDHPALVRRDALSGIAALTVATLPEGSRLVAAVPGAVKVLRHEWETLAMVTTTSLTTADYDGDGYHEIAADRHWQSPNGTWVPLPDAQRTAVGPGALATWNGSTVTRHTPGGSAVLARDSIIGLRPVPEGLWLVADHGVAFHDAALAPVWQHPLVAPTAALWHAGELLLGTAGGSVMAADGSPAGTPLGGRVVALAPHGDGVAVLLDDGGVGRLVLLDGTLVPVRNRSLTDFTPTALAALPDGFAVAGFARPSGSGNSPAGEVQLYDTELAPRTTLDALAPVSVLAVHGDDLLITAGSRLLAHDGEALRELALLDTEPTAMVAVGDTLAMTGGDGRYRLFALDDEATLLHTSADHYASLVAVALLDSVVVVAGAGGALWFTDVATHLPLHHRSAQGAPLALAATGRDLALVAAHGVAQMHWEGGGGLDLALGNGDLSIAPATVPQGRPVTVTATVHNRGESAADTMVELVLPGLAPRRTTGTVPAGGSRDFAFSIATAGLAPGLIPFTATARTDGEAETSNNRACGQLRVTEPLRPDLTVKLLATPGWGEVGLPVTLLAAVTNLGEAASEGGVLRLSTDTPLTETLASAWIEPLAPGAERELPLNWTPAAIGHYPLRLATDEPRDGDRSNDAVEWEFTVTAPELPDLAALPDTLTLTRYYTDTGFAFDVQVEIENRGAHSLTSMAGLRFDGLLKALMPLSLAPRERQLVSLTINCRNAGTHTVVLEADPLARLAERDEENNRASTTLTLTEAELLPDLAVEWLELVPHGNDYRLTAGLWNYGPATGTALVVLYIGQQRVAAQEVSLGFSTLALPAFDFHPAVGTYSMTVRLESPIPGDSNPSNDQKSLTLSVADDAGDSDTVTPVPVPLPPATVVAVAGGAVALGLLALAGTEAGRWRWLPFCVPLYSRIRRDRVLDHGTRQELLRHISSHPGQHLRQLGETFGLSLSTVIHHLRTLERESYVRSYRDGRFRRFYPVRVPGNRRSPDPRPEMQRRVLAVLNEQPGLSPSQIARALTCSRQALHYHLRQLERDGSLTLERASSREIHCYASRET